MTHTSKNFSKARLIGIAALLCGASIALTASAAESNHTVTSLGCSTDNPSACWIKVSPSIPAASNTCATDRTQVRWNLGSNTPGAAEAYRTALAAFMAGKTLTISPHLNLCVSGSPQLWYLYVR